MRGWQTGYRKGRSCFEQIATLRIIVQQLNERPATGFIASDVTLWDPSKTGQSHENHIAV